MEKYALTLKGVGVLPAIVSDVGISLPFAAEADPSKISIKPYKGIWDTGATGSVITSRIVKELGLVPTGQKEVHTAKGSHLSNTYIVNLFLKGNFPSQTITVTEAEKLAGGVDVLIGMDIITLGDFVITNHEGKTTMSFRVPSCESIDYVPSTDEENRQDAMKNMNRHQRRAFEARNRKLK